MSLSISSVFGAGAYWGKPFLPLALGALVAPSTYGYRERHEARRASFLAQLAEVASGQRVYVDESGMDERDDYSYGWCERGKRFEALKTGRRSGRINMIAAYCQQELMAPLRGRQAPPKPAVKRVFPSKPPRQILSLLTMTWMGVGRREEGVPNVW
jgi:hypothetical protein